MVAMPGQRATPRDTVARHTRSTAISAPTIFSPTPSTSTFLRLPSELVAGLPGVLVCRATPWGARHAARTVAALADATGDVGHVIVVAVADGPWPEPGASKARLRVLSGRVPVERLPYVTRWRFAEQSVGLPSKYAFRADAIARRVAALQPASPARPVVATSALVAVAS